MQFILPFLTNPATILVLLALFVLSLIAVAVAFHKAIQFAQLGVGQRNAAEVILDNWLGGRAEDAIRLASERRSVLARILQAVFSGVQARPADPAYAEELGRQTAIIELAGMTNRMRLLEMVVQAAPMLGLLGTVIGMIDAFSVLAVSEGAANAQALASGIWTALVTTALGLAVALVAYFVAVWLEGRIERERNLIEAAISAAIHGRVAPSHLGK